MDHFGSPPAIGLGRFDLHVLGGGTQVRRSRHGAHGPYATPARRGGELPSGGGPGVGIQIPDEMRALLPRLREPTYAKMLLVTLAEATPALEAGTRQTLLATRAR